MACLLPENLGAGDAYRRGGRPSTPGRSCGGTSANLAAPLTSFPPVVQNLEEVRASEYLQKYSVRPPAKLNNTINQIIFDDKNFTSKVLKGLFIPFTLKQLRSFHTEHQC